MSSSRASGLYVWIVSILVSLIAVSVIMGWYLHSVLLVQITPAFTPMQMNTALGFLLAAQGLWAFQKEKRIWLGVFAGLLIGLAGLTLIEYIFHVSTGIDQLFVKPFFSVGTYFPGRMALNTAVCFFLLGVSGTLVLPRNIVTAFIAASLSIFVGWTSVTSFLSYIWNINSDFAWGSASNMALHTSFCMGLLAFTLTFTIYRKIRHKISGVLSSFAVMFFITVVTLLITQMLVQVEVRKTKIFLNLKAESVARDVSSNLITQHQAFLRMASRWANGLYRTHEDWRADAANYLKDIGGIQSMVWTNPNYVIKWVYPEKGNELLINRDVRVRPASVKNIQTARDLKKPFVTKATELVVGGKGFGILYPLYGAGDKYEGILSIAYRFQEMFPHFLNTEGYFVQIFEDDELIYSSGKNDPILHEKWQTSHDADVMNKKWKILISPTLAVLQTQTNYVPLLVMGFGVLISTMLGLASLLYFRALDAEKRAWLISEWQKVVTASSHVLIISTDENGMVKTFNRAAEELLEYKAEEVVGKVRADLWHEESERPALEEYMMATRRGEVETREWTLVAKSGKKYLCNLTIRPMYSNDKKLIGFVGSLENITDKKAQQAMMLSTARLVSLGEMAAGIAHEVNNPLTIISGQAFSMKKILESRASEADEALIFKLERIEGTVQRIAKIIRGLRSFAREADPEDRQVVSINTVIEETLSFCTERFRNAGVELEVDLQPDMAFFGYGFQISQILLNLLNNAFDAVKSGGDANAKKVHLKTALIDEMIEIRVEDSGPGVSPELRNKIMQPFFTTKEVGEGLGLGLSISQGIAAAHQGSLTLDEKSAWTAFVLRIPRITTVRS